MKTIKLKKIALSNWKAQTREVSFKEGATRISGRNAIGKSTIMKSWCWLLSSYTDANSNRNSELFDNRCELSPDTPKASVKAWLEIDGYETTIERVAIAKFTRKRGTNEYVKSSSDEYRLYIDDIETSAGDFSKWIESNICPADMVNYCVDGEFICNLAIDDKNKARSVLENIVGEINEKDFKGDYSIIQEELKRFDVEAIRERCKNSIKPLEKRSEEIDTLVESKENTIIELSKTDFGLIKSMIDGKKADIQKIDDEILGKATSIAPILGQRNKILDIINEKTIVLNERRNEYNSENYRSIQDLKNKIKGIEKENDEIKKRNYARAEQYDRDCLSLKRKKEELERLTARRDELLKERSEEKSRVFDEGHCAYCGQELPPELLEKAKQKFNDKKESKLSSIISLGKSVRSQIEDCKSEIEKLEAIVGMGIQVDPYLNYDELQEEYNMKNEEFVKFEDTDEYRLLFDEIESIKKTIPEIPNNDNEELTNAKRVILAEIEKLNRQYGAKDTIESLKKDVAYLKEDKVQVGIQIARFEGMIDACKRYVQEKADIISYRINGELHGCKVDMYSEQKDGTVVGDCVIKNEEGIKYSTMNNSDRIIVALEMQKLFMRHYGIVLPLWLDEASVFDSMHLPKSDSQIIYLFASDGELVVE